MKCINQAAAFPASSINLQFHFFVHLDKSTSVLCVKAQLVLFKERY